MQTTSTPSHRRFSVLHLGIALAGTLGAACAWAGTINAAIIDKNGAPLPNAVIYATPVGGKALPKPANLETVSVTQENMQFSPYVLPVRVGTPVIFPNNDKIEHHVKSMSQAKEFEYKIYDRGVTPPPVVLDKAGPVTVYCVLHGWMRAHLLAVDTPYFVKSTDGAAKLNNLPEGTYEVKAWHPDLGTYKPQLAQTVKVTATGMQEVTFSFDFVPRKVRTPSVPQL